MLGLILTYLVFVLWGNVALACWFYFMKDLVIFPPSLIFVRPGHLKRTTFQYFHLWFNPGTAETANRFYKNAIKILKVFKSIKTNKLKNKVILDILSFYVDLRSASATASWFWPGKHKAFSVTAETVSKRIWRTSHTGQKNSKTSCYFGVTKLIVLLEKWWARFSAAQLKFHYV